MQAVRVHPAPSNSDPYSPANPAPASALQLDQNVPIPKPSKPGELLVRVKASTVVRDMLTWPETYHHEYSIPGNDLSGVVVEAYPGSSKFRPGDEVFGMAHPDRAATWAEYTIVKEEEATLKGTGLTWEQAAALPLSAQTAYEALFYHAGVPVPNDADIAADKTEQRLSGTRQKVLITGAAGSVGVYLVQLASLAGLHVVAATSSNDRNAQFVQSLGADETIEYNSLSQHGPYDFVIDTVGGDTLRDCWNAVKDGGTLITVDSSSFNFVDDHKRQGLYKDGVKALFFIVSGSSEGLHFLAHCADMGILQVFVLSAYALAEAPQAYEHASGRLTGRGKIVITI